MKEKISSYVIWTSYIIGLILFIFGLFDLTPTKFGYDSSLMKYGLCLVLYSSLIIMFFNNNIEKNRNKEIKK